MRTGWLPINEHAGDTRLRFAVQPDLSTRYYAWSYIGVPVTFEPTSVKWLEKEEK